MSTNYLRPPQSMSQRTFKRKIENILKENDKNFESRTTSSSIVNSSVLSSQSVEPSTSSLIANTTFVNRSIEPSSLSSIRNVILTEPEITPTVTESNDDLANVPNEKQQCEYNYNNNIESDDSVSNSDEDIEQEETWSDFLRNWAIECQIKREHLNALLKGMIKKGISGIPSDARTLLATPKHVSIKDITGGQYWHRGLKHVLVWSNY